MKSFLGFLLIPLFGGLLAAQTVTPVAGDAEKKDETVQLSPFEVTAESGGSGNGPPPEGP